MQEKASKRKVVMTVLDIVGAIVVGAGAAYFFGDVVSTMMGNFLG